MDTNERRPKYPRIQTTQIFDGEGATQIAVYRGEKTVPMRFRLNGNIVRADSGFAVEYRYQVVIRARYKDKADRDLTLVSESRMMSNQYQDRDVRISTYVNRLRKKPPEEWYIFLITSASGPCAIVVNLKPSIRIMSRRKIKLRSRDERLREERQLRRIKYDVDQKVAEIDARRDEMERERGETGRGRRRKWKRIFRIFRFAPVLRNSVLDDYNGAAILYECPDLHRIRKISLLISGSSNSGTSLFTLYLSREGAPPPGEKRRIEHMQTMIVSGTEERFVFMKTKDLRVARGDRFVLVCESVGTFAISFMVYQSTKMILPKTQPALEL